ncbi:hypothetical protein [Streptomyces sp. enrichment culture]|uniref:hypothetical protein n=1 Tax=Streptomyces sp. enrichment culture TaxID=1795815 RepID=UPI003F5531B9
MKLRAALAPVIALLCCGTAAGFTLGSAHTDTRAVECYDLKADQLAKPSFDSASGRLRYAFQMSRGGDECSIRVSYLDITATDEGSVGTYRSLEYHSWVVAGHTILGPEHTVRDLEVVVQPRSPEANQPFDHGSRTKAWACYEHARDCTEPDSVAFTPVE